MKKKLLLFVFFLSFFCTQLYAGLSVTPARSELRIAGEQSYEGFYIIKNGFDTEIEVKITAETWHNSVNNKDVKVDEWLVMPERTIKLAPEESAEIGYTVNSKNYTGSLSAMVSFTHKSPGHQGISMMTSVPIYITIDGTQKIDFEITDIRAERPKNMENYSVAYLVYNSGNVPLRTKGSLKVLKGKKVVSSQVIGEQSPVYPGLNRAFYEMTAKLPKGKYKLNISLNALGKTVEKSIQIRVNKYGDIAY